MVSPPPQRKSIRALRPSGAALILHNYTTAPNSGCRAPMAPAALHIPVGSLRLHITPFSRGSERGRDLCFWPITSVSSFGVFPLLVDPDITQRLICSD
jgi:hypothetical protein